MQNSSTNPYKIQFIMVSWTNFFYKVIFVICLSYMLLPLMYYKNSMPSAIYIGTLLAIHVVILVVYLWKVAFRQLDPDWRSLLARCLGLAFFVGLLLEISEWSEPDTQNLPKYALELGVLCIAHTFILLLLMIKVEKKYLNQNEPLLMQE